MKILRATTVFDGERVLHGHDLVLDDRGRVVDLRAMQPAPIGVEVIDHGPGTTLLPGLVDGHQHLSWGCTVGVLDGLPDDPAALRAQTLANARRALAGGVTTLQDLGDGGYSVVDVREATRGDRTLPRILASGPPITTPGGHCHFLAGAQTRPDAVRAAVHERADRGVDVIKVMISGGNVTPGSLPWQSQFDRDAVRHLVDAAHALGLPVAAHAHGIGAVRDAVACGVDSIEHCTFMSADGVDHDGEVMRELAASGIVVRITPGTTSAGPPMPPALAARFGQIIAGVRMLLELGARVVVSTDAGVSPNKPHDVMGLAVRQVGEHTADPIDVLVRSTSAAADALGLTGECGRLAPGRAGDVLVVRGDPTRDLDALLAVEAVYREGEQVAGPAGGVAPGVAPTG